jgi:hypothetical protein
VIVVRLFGVRSVDHFRVVKELSIGLAVHREHSMLELGGHTQHTTHRAVYVTEIAIGSVFLLRLEI